MCREREQLRERAFGIGLRGRRRPFDSTRERVEQADFAFVRARQGCGPCNHPPSRGRVSDGAENAFDTDSAGGR